MTQTVEAWAARAALMPAKLVETTPSAVRAAAVVLQEAARANIASATGGDSVLSRIRSGKGGRIRLDLKVTGAGSGTTARVIPRGPIMLVESGSVAHRQPFVYKYKRRVKAKRTGVVAFGGRVYTRVNHPGTKGKYPVGKAFGTAKDDAGKTGAQVFTAAVRAQLGAR